MKHTADEKLNYLLDEIGGVDDRMLAEAAEYRAVGRRAFVTRTLAAIACTLLLCATVLAAVLMYPRLPLGGAPSKERVYALDALLQSADAGCYTLLSSEKEIAYFGETYLLWQYEGEETVYRSRALTVEERDRLFSLIGDGRTVGEDAPAQFARVWVTLGNGEVLTPYLPATPGNVSSVIFDYNAEISPSRALVDCISDILSS